MSRPAAVHHKPSPCFSKLSRKAGKAPRRHAVRVFCLGFRLARSHKAGTDSWVGIFVHPLC